MTETDYSLVNQLMRLDLTKNEARIYIELLRLGPSNAGPLIKNLGLHRQYIYAAIDSLVERRLVSFLINRGRRIFQAAAPENILALEEERRALAQLLVPKLSALEPLNQDKLEVTTHFGPEEFFKSLISVLHSAKRGDGAVRVIGGASDEAFYNALGDYYFQYLEQGQKLKVRKLLIAPEHASHIFKAKFAREKGNELRTLKGALTSPTYLRVTHELTTIEIYHPQVMIIKIWNKAVARGYLEHFELLWPQAVPYHVQ